MMTSNACPDEGGQHTLRLGTGPCLGGHPIFEIFDATQSPIAAEALRRIQDLYAVEDDISGYPAAHRRTQRQARAKPLLDAFHAWAIARRRRLSSKAPLPRHSNTP